MSLYLLLGALCAILLTGCNLGGGSSDDGSNHSPSSPTPSQPHIMEKLQAIEVQQVLPAIPAGSRTPIIAMGKMPVDQYTSQEDAQLSEFEEVNINQFVNFTVVDESILTIVDNQLYGMSQGETVVYAEANGIVSNEMVVKVIEGVCGTGVNDSNPKSATGECLKVISGRTDVTKDIWFTFTPSLAFVNAMGYKQVNNGESRKDELSYSLIYDVDQPPLNSRPPYSPQREFVLFRQDGLDTEWNKEKNYGENGQIQVHCRLLKEISFAGRNDWRRPTFDELFTLYNEYPHAELYTQYGAPISHVYHTSTKENEIDVYPNYHTKGFIGPRTYSTRWSTSLSGGCISNTPQPTDTST